MKIALITSVLCGGGAARVLVNMANYWSRSGHTVTLFSFEDGSQPSFYPVDAGVQLVFLDIFRASTSTLASIKNNVERCFKIRRALLSGEPDVVISFIDTANVRVLFAMLGSRVPVIVSERVHLAYEDIGRCWNVLRRFLYPFADSVVVQTEAVAQHLAGWGLRDVRVIPNPVQSLRSTGAAPHFERPSILAVGRMAEQKNYPLLLRAFAQVRQKHPDWHLYVVGLRAEDEAVESLMDRFSLHDRVHFVGQVADVRGAHEQADIFVLSSLYEGFPNALCEAMASGLPCISTDSPSGPSEIIENGENGILIANADEAGLVEAIELLIDDGALRQKLGRNAEKLVERYSEDRIMGLWDSCIQSVRSET